MNTLISVAHAGGQGKTTLAQLLYLASKKLAQPYRVVAADFLDESGHSKLGKLYPDVVEEFGIGASLTAARNENNPNAALRYWDKMGHVLLSGGTVVDVGANVIASLLDWSVDRHLKKLQEKKSSPKVDFFCICKAERHAIDNVASLVHDLIERDSFKIGKVFVVQNDVGGPFLNNDLKSQIDRVSAGHQINYLRLPKCQSEIWPAMEKEGVSIESAMEMDEDQLVEVLGVDLWTAASGSSELRTWFDFNVRMLRDAGVFARDGLRVAKKAS